jgi:hypothetical protein
VRHPVAHSLLFVAFVLGGLVAPSLHRVWHAEEQARERAAHVAAGHHHHAGGSTHGAEVVAPCPEPVAVHLQCVLCHGVSVYLPAARAAVLAPAHRARLSAVPLVRAASAALGLLSIRGPPEPVA